MSPVPRTVVLVSLALVLRAADSSAAQCPTAVLFEPTADGTTDAGWTGYIHDLSLDGPNLFLSIDCGPAASPCGTCAIAGVIPDPVLQPQRCVNDHSIACTQATEVADCGGSNRCRTFLGPPQTVAAAGIGFCMMQTFASNVGGSVDVETGAFAPRIPVRILADGPFHAPCARCVGDPVPNDGVPNGTCDAGQRAGLACDANATSPFSDYGSTSFDCPVPFFSEFDAGSFAASTGTTTRTLSSASPNCGPAAPGEKCLCQTCNTLAAEPCFTNADCPPSGGNPGICGGNRCVGGSNAGAPCIASTMCPSGACNRVGEPPKPDSCLDDSTTPFDCVDVGGGEGECLAGPSFNYCVNHPNRGCVLDGDCDGVSGACQTRMNRCFLGNAILGGSLTVSGSATPPVANVSEPTDLALLGCVGATTSVILNNIGGYPGLVRSVQPGRLTFLDGAFPTPTPTLQPPPTATPPPSITPTGTATPTATATPGPCPALPATCAAPGNAKLHIKDRSVDQLQWKWTKGDATTVADFGDPVASDSYVLCLYDDAGLQATLEIPAGGLCRGRPCWRTKATGFLYRNKDATPHGVTQLTLKAGDAGRASVQLSAKRPVLPLPPLPSLTGSLEVQLRNQGNGICWGATFTPPFDKRTEDQLKDRAD